MEISDLELFNVRLPRIVGGAPLEAMLVCLTASSGIQGWGEAPRVWRNDELPERRLGLLACLAGRSVFSMAELSPAEVWEQRPVAFAVETALWDLAGKLTRQPVCNLWGGTFRAHIPLAVRIDCPQEADVRRLAGELLEHGCHALVLRGTENALQTAAATLALLQAVGPNCEVYLDGQATLTPDGALRLCAELPERAVGYVLDPIAGGNLGALASLARLTNVPLAVGRSIASEADVMAVARGGGIHSIVIDPRRVGGVLAAQRAIAVASAGGLAPSLQMSESAGVAAAVMLHLAAALPGLEQHHCIDHPQWSPSLLVQPLALIDGTAAVPYAPGLGIELDRDKLEWAQP